MLSEDGSGRGAALVAAVATRMKAQTKAHKEGRNGNNNVKNN